jgi:hypothetical protein
MCWKERTSPCKVSSGPHTLAVARVQVPCLSTWSPFALPTACKVSSGPHTLAVARVQVPCLSTWSPFALPTALQQASCHIAGLSSCHQDHVTHKPTISPLPLQTSRQTLGSVAAANSLGVCATTHFLTEKLPLDIGLLRLVDYF